MPPASPADPPPFDALIVAGGSSRRMGFDKLLARLGDLPVIVRSALAFRAVPQCVNIVLVCPPPRRAEFEAALARHGVVAIFADAGRERQDSVASGLDTLASLNPCHTTPDHAARLVAIHDAARPLVEPDLIRQTVATAARHGAAACAAPVTDTLMRADPSGNALAPVSRENLWAMQTPQVFALPLIRAAIEKARREQLDFTDDVSALIATGHPVALVKNLGCNPKLTFPSDLHLAEALLRTRQCRASANEAGT